MNTDQAQLLHDTRKNDDPDHDQISCWCCCWTCDFTQDPDGDITQGPGEDLW